MATTVTYKGNTLTTLTNQTKVLKTAGKYMEDDITIDDESSGGSAVVVTEETDAGGGIIKHITAVDLSNDTVTAAVLLSGYTAHNFQGSAITGTYEGGGTPINNQNKSFTPDETGVVLSADVGYTGLGTVTIAGISSTYIGSGVPSGTAFAPALTLTSSTGVITGTNTFTAGYYTASTKTSTFNLTTQAAQTITPGTTSQYVNSYRWLTGSQTIKGDANLVAGNIKSGISIFGVSGTYGGTGVTISALTVTPTETEQTFNAGTVDGYKPVTVSAISSNYVGTNIARKSAADLTAANSTVTVPAGYYSSQVTKNISGGSAFTPAVTITTNPTVTINSSTGLVTATYAGSSSITPTVTAGYVAAGTAGTVSTSGTQTLQLTSKAAATYTPTTSNQTIASGTYLTGTQTISGDANLVAGNIKKNVSIFGITGTYEGSGGGTGLQVATATATPSSAGTSIQFTGLAGEPTSFSIIANDTLATGASPYKTAAVVYDGTSLHGQTITNTSNAQVSYDGTNFTKSYSNGTLTVTGSTYFQAVQYKLIYTYGGSDIGTANVQVGSGATSITFTELEEEPSYWSCIFKSNFSTSSGYQRVIVVAYDGTSVYGMEMDSSAKASTAHWSYTYNNGSLTITSSGTNAGGYFHQPGYYQLTYATEGGGGLNLQNKTVSPTTSQQTVTYDTGYTGLGTVTVNAISPVKSAADLTANLSTVTVPAGYYSTQVTKNVTSATAFAPAISLTSSTGVVTGTNTFTSAYYAAGTTTSTINLTTQVAQTIYTSTADQTIASYRWLTGTQTIKSVTYTGLTASTILSGTTVQIGDANNASRITQVAGTLITQNCYVSSATPASSLGANGDIYIKTS